MTADTPQAGAAGSLPVRHAERWRELDPLLPDPGALPEPGEDGGPLAAGSAAAAVARVLRPDPASLDACWTALETHRLTARVAGPDAAAAMDTLLGHWRERIPAGAAADSSAVVTWPSRDVAVAAAFVRHGLAPLTVIAARPAGRPVPDGNPEVVVRRAAPGDLAAVVALRLATIRYDAQFGVVRERPGTVDRLRELTGQVFARPDPWVWMAVQDGRIVGMVSVDQPPHAGWLQAMTSGRPVGYLDCIGVAARRRGSGIGTALLAHAHRALDDAGVAVTLLHHALPNPLSTPLYGRHGYRPLWTIWETRPATALR
jgi:ribosomal protein S18 acetylase RimI-like enzyme